MEPVVVDNLCNSKAAVLTRVAAISEATAAIRGHP